ncbi:MAG: site-specific integrase [Gammaproteobacteria bacterium]|jgi:integrase|nr:integrase [Gammaproteobacteria bacterium]MDP6095750.1 site-specific integrase [Gammaproteobacteria bacterium]|tara:strand:- start:2593 stop:3684 length:1092 start_codon:yes stop_codon:yes gene_type:complete
MATTEKRTTKDGKTSYRCKIRRKGQSPLSATLNTKSDAERWCIQHESAILAGRHFNYVESRYRSLRDAIARYGEDILMQLADSSGRITHLAWWESQIGDKVLGDITPSVVIECRRKLQTEPANFGRHQGKLRSNATVNRYVASLRALLGYATSEWQWLDENPCLRIKHLREPKGRCRFLSESEQDALLLACKNCTKYPEMLTIVLLAITTGMRRGEIIGLRWHDIDFKYQRITLRITKNNETRSVPLAGPALTSLKERAKVRPIDSTSFVFPSRGKKGLTKSFNMDYAWILVRTEADLVDFRFHDLRHTAASFLAMSGATLREIADILGHKTLAMVQRYSHLTDDHRSATVERMVDKMFRGSQ